jgi:hypothetical protein
MLIEKHALEREVLGSPLVYPGHPVAVALMITHVFPDLAAASAPTEHGFPEALGSLMVGGAGGAVSSGLHLLHLVDRGLDLDTFEDRLDEGWSHEAHAPDRMASGSAQGRLAFAALKERLPAWLEATASDAPSISVR